MLALRMEHINEYDVYLTPNWLAQDMVSLAGVQPGFGVLEPSAGYGALAMPARDAGGFVECIDTNPSACETLVRKGFSTVQCDFLTVSPDPRFDTVILNPPFESFAYVHHVLHGIKFLMPGGRLVALVEPSYMDSYTNSVLDELRKLTIEQGRLYVLTFPKFTIRGLSVRTAVLVIDL